MSKIKVADYLIQELNKLGIEDFFGLREIIILIFYMQ